MEKKFPSMAAQLTQAWRRLSAPRYEPCAPKIASGCPLHTRFHSKTGKYMGGSGHTALPRGRPGLIESQLARALSLVGFSPLREWRSGGRHPCRGLSTGNRPEFELPFSAILAATRKVASRTPCAQDNRLQRELVLFHSSVVHTSRSLAAPRWPRREA